MKLGCKWSTLIKQCGTAKYTSYRFHATLNVSWDCQVTLEKTLTLPKHGDIILNSMTQTRENGILLGHPSLLWQFFESAILKVTWSQLCSKFLLKNNEAHLQQHFEIHPTFDNFTDIDQHTC